MFQGARQPMPDKESILEIESLSSSRRDRLRFAQFLFDLYQDAPLWVPPLIRDELKSLDARANPGLENCELQLWLAIRNGRCVGRIAGVIHRRDNKLRNVEAARFCLLDFEDDPAVPRLLLETVENWAVEKEMTLLEGPFGLTTFERSAVLVDGFDRLPTVVSSYNFPYYGPAIESVSYTHLTLPTKA